MTKKIYLDLCFEFNRVVRKLSKNIDLIPCLTSIIVIKENQQYYLNYYKKFHSYFFLIIIPVYFLINFFLFFYHIAITIFLVLRNKKKKFHKVDCIFLSHGFSELNYKDIYFSNIKKKIFYQKKIKFDTLYINQGKRNFFLSNEKLINCKYLTISDIGKIIYKIAKNFFYIFKLLFIEKNKKVLFYLLSNVVSPSSLINFLIVEEMLKILKIGKAKYLFFTFEGFPYEKYLVSKINKSMSVKTFGYQHTGISHQNNSLIKLTQISSLPNFILCISKIDQLTLLNKFKRQKIINIGKNNWNYNKLNINKDWKIKKNKLIYKCLILFENNHNEINKLLINFQNNKKIKFTIRSHPNFEKKLYKIKNLNKIKISRSKKSLIKELQNNDFLIYKSSSVVFNGILLGLLPLRIKNNFLDENPLKNIVLRNEISNLKDVMKIKDLIKYNKYSSILSKCQRKFNTLDLKFLESLK